jgi:CBS domain-containing protein
MPTPSIRDLMTQTPTCCTPQTPINEVARMMVEEDCGLVPVVENLQDLRLVGVVTDRDLVVRILAKDIDPAAAMVHQAMSEEIATLGVDAGIGECARVMSEMQVRRVPIVDGGGRVIGIVAQADLARAGAQEAGLQDEVAGVVSEVSEPSGGSRAV